MTVDQNYRSVVHKKNVIVIKMQKVRQFKDFEIDERNTMNSLMIENEIILLEDVYLYLSEFSIKYQETDVYLDYLYDSKIEISAQIVEKNQKESKYFLRKVFNVADQTLRSLFRCHSIRAELELKHFFRQHFIENFDEHSCISVFLLIFIDEFNLYRNMYRSFMSMYFFFAAFEFHFRNRRFNVISVRVTGELYSVISSNIDILYRLTDRS